MIPSRGRDRLDRTLLIGDRQWAERYSSRRNGGCGDVELVAIATHRATTAEVAAVQVPQLHALAPARVVLQLGPQDLVDGCDESYFHARVVELCDAIQQTAPHAEVEIAAVPPAAVPPHLEELRRRCNAAARVTAELRGFRWSGGGR